MERLSGSGKNERLSKAFSQALRRAPLLVPVVATGAALEAAVNPPAVYAQQTPQRDCVVLVQTENPNTGKKTTANLSSRCENITRVDIDFPKDSLIKGYQGTSYQLSPAFKENGSSKDGPDPTLYVIMVIANIGTVALLSYVNIRRLIEERRDKKALEERVEKIVQKYQQEKAPKNQDARKT